MKPAAASATATRIFRRTRAILRPLALLGLLASCNASVDDGKSSVSQTTTNSSVAAANGVSVVPAGIPGNISAANTLVAHAIANGVLLAWTPPNKDGPFRYTVYRKILGTGSYTPILTDSPDTKYNDLSAAAGVSYMYKIRAVRPTGQYSDTNEESAEPISSFGVQRVAQTGPTDLTVSWSAAVGADSYDIVSGTGAGDFTTVLQANATSPAVLSGLIPGKTYVLQVIAKNSVGLGALVRSSTVPRATLMTGSFNFTAVAYPPGIRVSWTPFPVADHYKVVYGTASGNYTTVVSTSATQSPVYISGLAPATTYYVMVYAMAQSAELAASAEQVVYVGTPSSYSWTYDSGTTAQYTSSNGFSTLGFSSGGVCQLGFSSIRDFDNSAGGFGGGTKLGVDWVGSSLQLANSGGCNGAATNCQEFDPSWTPKYSNIIFYAKFKSTDTFGNGTAFTPSINTFGASLTTVNPGTLSLNAASKVRYGLSDGGNGYFNNTGTTVTSYTSFTHSVWVKPTGTLANSWSTVSTSGTNGCNSGNGVFGSFASAGSDTGLELAVGTNGLSLSEHSGGWAPVVAAVPVALSGWHHIAVRAVSATQLEIYLDGRLVTTAVNTARTRKYSMNWFASKGACSSQPFNGEIDEYAGWNTALSAAEIQTIYQRQGAKYSGLLLSRVIPTSLPVPWMKWWTSLPFGKELTATAESTSDYVQVSTTLATNLVGLWHLNEPNGTTGAGSVKDASSYGHHGTPQASAVLGSPGRFNTAATFNGTGSFITMGTPAPLVMSTALTVSAWIFPTGPGSTGSGGVIVNKEGEYELVRYPNGTIWYALANTSPGWVVTNVGGSTPLFTWSHVVWTYDKSLASNQLKVYVNGVLVDQRTGTGNIGDVIPAQNEFRIGYRQSNSEAFAGSIDEVGVWSRSLSTAEVQQIYRRGANRLSFQLRQCTASNCSDDPNGANWKGPDGTSLTSYSELNNNSAPVAMNGTVLASSPSFTFASLSLPDLYGPYIQYRALLASDDVTSPELVEMRFKGGYDSSSPSIYGNSGMPFKSLNGFSEQLGSSCLGGVTYNLSVDKTNWYYWNGSAWVLANGTVAQSNNVYAVSANIADFGVQTGAGTLYVKAFLSSSGSQKCELDGITVNGRQ